MCGADGFTYASPCNAGCTSRNLTDPDVSEKQLLYSISCSIASNFVTFLQNQAFSDCGCVLGNILANISSIHESSGDMGLERATAMPGFCNRQEQCNLVAPFLLILGVAILLQYCRTVPLLFVSMR